MYYCDKCYTIWHFENPSPAGKAVVAVGLEW